MESINIQENKKRPHECTFHVVSVEDETAAVVAAAAAVHDALASAFGAFAVAVADVAAVVAHAGAVFEVAAPAAAASLFHGDAALGAVSLGNVLVEVAAAVGAVIVDAEAIVVDVGVSSPAMDLPA
jgi:hypothetical protein